MTTPDPAWTRLPATRIDASGTAHPTPADTAEEVPIAFSYGGIAHAVMMATPADLEDFAVGFSVTEAIAPTQAAITALATRPIAEGIELDITLAPTAFAAFLSRRRMRNLRGQTSCGLCGVEELADIARPAAPLPRTAPIPATALRTALANLRDHQPLSRRTHAAHAAAWADRAGTIVLAREDVGRHSALDKLIGACLRAGIDPATGFCLVTSRCSFEMVQKAIAAGFPTLVAVSAPTGLAVRQAQAAGLTLVARAAAQEMSVYASPDARP